MYKAKRDLKRGFRFKCTFVSKYVKPFLRNTTLQALYYVGDDSLTIWERMYFFFCFVSFVAIATNFAFNVYVRWDTNPVIIGIEGHASSIRELPFPAVTICNMNAVLRSKVSKFPYYSLGYAMTQKICLQNINYSIYDNLWPENKDDTFTKFIWENSQTCDKMLLYCSYGMEETRCSEYFREVLLDDGICCVFNILHPSYMYKGEYLFVRDYTSSVGTIPVDWNLEKGYANNLPLYYYPREPRGVGVSMGLSFVLNANLSEYHCSTTLSDGFKIIPHNPIDIPHVKDIGSPLMTGYQYRFRLKVSSWKATPALRSIHWRRRQCLFNDEVQLQYFRYYTRINCEMECDSQFMLRRCNCIPYHLPLIHKNASFCHVRDFNCEIVALKELNDVEHVACKSRCLPSCFNVQYSARMYRSPMAETNYTLSQQIFRKYSARFVQQNLVQVDLYFSDELYRSLVRTPYTSFTDYLSQTGGIMALLMGFSFISVVEIVYFFIIRPIFDFFLDRNETGIATSGYSEQNPKETARGETHPQLAYPRKPLALRRKEIVQQTGYNGQKMYKGFLKTTPIYRIRPLQLNGKMEDINEQQLFPYTE